jgi:class 3 adenylate cyclase
MSAKTGKNAGKVITRIWESCPSSFSSRLSVLGMTLPQVGAKSGAATFLLMQLQAKWADEGKHIIDIGISINTGVDNIAAPGKKMDCIVIGDNVNFSARLESLTRQYNNHIIISEFTYDKVKNITRVNELGSVTCKGKQQPAVVYGLVGLNG